MTSSEGREWALKTFGPDGVKIREAIPRTLSELHVRMADAQAASGMRARSVYGQIWRGALEAFGSEFGGLPNAGSFVPQGANYRVPSIEGVALFPWRFAAATPCAASSTRIITSPARLALFHEPPNTTDDELNLAIDRPELTPEDHAVLAQRARSMDELLERHRKVVVVAYASSLVGLHSVEWGDVSNLSNEGFVEWGFHEHLAHVVAQELTAVNSDSGSFTSGEAPRPIVAPREESQGDV